MSILKKLNGKSTQLALFVFLNGSMIWNYTDKATLTMKNFSEDELKQYLSKISDEALYMLIMFTKLKVREKIYLLV